MPRKKPKSDKTDKAEQPEPTIGTTIGEHGTGEVLPGVVVLESEDIADAGKFTTEAQEYFANDVVIAICTNGSPGPTQQCRATLELSEDNVSWAAQGSHLFGPVDNTTYIGVFKLFDIAHLGAWRHYRIAFGGHAGGPVKVAVGVNQAPTTPAEQKKLDDAKDAKGGKADKADKPDKDEPEPLKKTHGFMK